MSKRIIEDVINEALTGEYQKNALDLMAWLRENKFNPLQSSKTTWKISAKSCVVCYFRFDFNAGAIQIQPIISEYKNDSLTDNLKQIALTNKVHGRYCGERCHGSQCSYMLKTLFGEKNSDSCGQSIVFTNPNADENECIKELIRIRKNVIQKGVLMPILPRNFSLQDYK